MVLFNRKYIACVAALFGMLLTGCIESFDVPVRGADVRFLAIDGYLNTTTGNIQVNLHRSTKITETNIPIETNAIVMLEDAENNTYALPETETGTGRYTGIAPSVAAGTQYRIYIKTVNGNEYRSRFVTIKPTPPITNVEWKAYADGTQIVVDTEGINQETRYYRWTFEETWEYHSRYTSYWIFINEEEEPEVRFPADMINVCYRTELSTRIFTTSTAGLSEDRVNDFKITFLPKGTDKLGRRYSILVKQYAISKETYEYLEKLKKTSQDLGGLFSPQPSKVTGNISNIADASEVVLGYFDAGQSTEKRIMITPQDLPSHLQILNQNLLCHKDTLRAQSTSEGDKWMLPKGRVLVDRISDDMGITIGFTYASEECADCRVKGGVTLKPVFWP